MSKWFGIQVAGGFVRWAVATIITAVCIAWGFAPGSWLAAFWESPPEWLAHPITRIVVILIGAAIVLLLLRKGNGENPTSSVTINAPITINVHAPPKGFNNDAHIVFDIPKGSPNIIDAANVASITDTANTSFTVTFAKGFKTDKYAIIPGANTPHFDVTSKTPDSASVTFSSAPAQVSLKFTEKD